jgi:hypothetical protein
MTLITGTKTPSTATGSDRLSHAEVENILAVCAGKTVTIKIPMEVLMTKTLFLLILLFLLFLLFLLVPIGINRSIRMQV